MSRPSEVYVEQQPVTLREWEREPRPPIDLEGHIATERDQRWEDDRGNPPTEAAHDAFTRWSLVREARRKNAALGFAVDHVRRIERAVRPDQRMLSRRGEFDALTVIALMWFQRDQGLPITGVADRQTLDALLASSSSLGRCRSDAQRPSRALVPDEARSLERFLYYRSLIIDAGGLFDDRHRSVNVLVLRDAQLRQGRRGPAVHDTGWPWTEDRVHAFTTVSVWVERKDSSDEGDVVDVMIRERPGFVPLEKLRHTRRRPELAGGQYICDLGTHGPFLPDAHATVPRFTSQPGAIPVVPPRLPLIPDTSHADIAVPIDSFPNRYGRFFCELMLMQETRRHRDEWTGVRVTLLEGGQLPEMQR